MRFATLCFAWLALFAYPGAAQTIVNDPDVDIHVPNPAFAEGKGPVVAVDSGHYNYHTMAGRYAPFAALLRNDGFAVTDFNLPFNSNNFSKIRLLVISNALPAELADHWKMPAPSAFTPSEIVALRDWVVKGGSLLLIADHQPFSRSARDLALAFGFQFEDGVVERDPMDGRRDIFSTADGSLRPDVITQGRKNGEAVTKLRTFAGSAFRAPPGARPIIVFPSGFKIHDCGLPCPAGAAEQEAGGLLQGAVMSFGKGRIAVFGEAAMFSAQLVTTTTPPFRFGFGAAGAEQNKQFILNLVHWLAGILPSR